MPGLLEDRQVLKARLALPQPPAPAAPAPLLARPPHYFCFLLLITVGGKWPLLVRIPEAVAMETRALL